MRFYIFTVILNRLICNFFGTLKGYKVKGLHGQAGKMATWLKGYVSNEK
jgi:hypothetical protein